MRSWIVGGVGVGMFGALVASACGDSTFTGESSADGSADAVANDSSTSDAGPNTSDADDPCTDGAPHTLCDDFDSVNLSAVWSKGSPGCATPSLDTSAFVSSPRSLAAANDAGAVDCAYFEAPLTTTATHMHCEADVRLDAPPTQFFGFFKLTTSFDDVGYYEVALEHKAQGAGGLPIVVGDDVIFVDGGTIFGSANLNTTSTAVADWFHVVVDLDYGKKRISATVAGVSGTLVPTRIPDGGMLTQGAALRVGFEYKGDGGAALVRYDNVFCDVD